MAVFLDNFEDGILHVLPWWQPLGDGTKTVITDPTDANNKVLEMWIERKLYPSNGPARTQIDYNPATSPPIPRYFPWRTTHGWSFRMYVPDDWITDVHGELFWQLHQWAASPTFTGYSIPCSLSVQEEGQIRIKILTAPEMDASTIVYNYFWNQYTIRAGHWYYFVINTHWDYRTNGNGFHNFYASEDTPCTSNDLIHAYSGGTGFNEEANNPYTGYPTIGIYKYDWQYQTRVDDSAAAGVDYRKYLFDDLYMQDSAIVLGGSAPSIPVAPSNMNVTGVTSSSITVTWNDNSSDEDNFRLEHSDTGTGSWTEITLPANTTTHILESLGNGVTKYFRVRASNTAGNSAYSNIDSGTTQTFVPVNFTEDFEAVLTNPPWSHLGDGSVARVANPSGTGFVTEMKVVRQLYASGADALASSYFEGDAGSGVDKFMKPFEEWGVKFALFIPSGWVADPSAEALFKFVNETYQTGLSLLLDGDSLRVKVLYNVNETPDIGTSESINYSDVVTGITANQWYYFTINTKWNYTAGNVDGYHNIYMKAGSEPDDSNQIFNYEGPTGNADVNNAQTVFQIHKFTWQNQTDVDASTQDRTYYYNDYYTQNEAIVVTPATGTTHNNTLQGLLNANAGGTVNLVFGDTYIETDQVDIPANTILNGNGATLKADPTFYQDVYNGQYDLHKFLLNMLGNGGTAKDFTIDGDNKQLWGGIVVEGTGCHIEDVNVDKTWFSGVWFEEADGSDILRGTFTDAANVPGNWATGMIEMRDIVGLTIDGVTFVDTLSIGCGGIKAKALSETNVRHLEDVTIKNCDFDLFKWHGWLNEGDLVIGNYAIELSKNRIKNLQILDNTMNTTISVAGDYDHDVDYNYGKLIVKRNHFYPEHQSSNILETSQSGVVFEDNYIEGGGYVISNFLNWTVAGVIDPYFNLRFNNNVFYFPLTRPTTLFRFAREYNTVEFKNNTIYGPTGIREVLNFADATCDGTNIDFNQNTITCFGADTLLKSGVNYTDLDTTDNKWHGAFNGVAENVGTIPFKNLGTKPFPFFETLEVGYGAVDPNASASAPDAPSNLQVTSVTNDTINLSWEDNSDNETGFELEHSPNGTDTWTTIDINDNEVTYSHGGLNQIQTVFYRIRAINAIGNSAYSNITSDTTSSTADIFTEIFDNLFYDPPWTQRGLGVQELSTDQQVISINSLRLYLEAVKGVYSIGTDARALVEYSPNVAPVKYPPWFTSTGNSFAVYIPSSMEVDDQFITLIYAQAQSSYDVFTSVEPFAIYLKNGYFRIAHRTAPVGDNNAIVTVDDETIMPLVAGHWYFFVINSHWDYNVGGNGYHKVYLRQDLPPTQSNIVIDYVGPTGYNDTANTQDTVHTWFSLYKWSWANDDNVQLSLDAGITGNELYFDDILIQNADIDVPSAGSPIIPSNLRIDNTTNESITIAWNDNSDNEDNFILSHSPNGVDTWTEVLIEKNTELYPHFGLSEDQEVFYKIRTINASGESADTDVISGIAEGDPPVGTVPDAPTSLTLDVVTRVSISVSWQDNSDDETSFTLSHSPDGSNWTDVVLNANRIDFQHNELGTEETYYYKVRADNAAGPSAYSNTIQATTLPNPNTGWLYRIVGGNRRGSLPVQGRSVFE